MASTPRHHLVPQFLLRRFADPDEKLVMVKREDLNVALLTTVNNACNEAGFYRIDTEDVAPSHQDGHDPESLEKTLAVFEARADRSIQNLIDGTPPWSREDRYNLVNFTAFQYVRGWHFRNQIDDLGTLAMRREMLSDPQRLEQSARRFLRRRGEPATPEAVAEFIASAYGPDGPRLVMSRPHAIQTSFKFAVETVAPMLFARSIRLVHFEADSPLLTGDSPVVTWSPALPDERVVSLVDAATITLPLSPALALTFARGGRDAVATAGATRARQINTAVADIAEHWIYHSPETEPLKGLMVPAERPRWQDEKLAARIDDEGRYRELWQTVQR